MKRDLYEGTPFDLTKGPAGGPYGNPGRWDGGDYGAQAMGDPIERDPESVVNDLNEGWTTQRVAREIHGVVTTQPNGHVAADHEATAKRRQQIREDRKQR